MQAWEYLVVEFFRVEKKGMGFSVAADPHYRPRWINGEEQNGWENAVTFREYLSEYGSQGWEYAGHAPPELGGFACVLKRAI